MTEVPGRMHIATEWLQLVSQSHSAARRVGVDLAVVRTVLLVLKITLMDSQRQLRHASNLRYNCRVDVLPEQLLLQVHLLRLHRY